MKRFLAFPVLIAALAIASFANITVTAPANGVTVQSPVTFVASATSRYEITGMAISVDSKQVYSTTKASLDTSIAMTSGTHAVVVEATNSEGRVYSDSLTLVVKAATSTPPAALHLTCSPPANGTVGSRYLATLDAAGGTAPYKWSIASGSLPAGLTLSSSGTISGTPTTAVASSFSITAKDSESTPQSATGKLTITVIKGSGGVTPPPATLTLTTSTLATGTVGSSYSAALQATGGTAPYTWSVASGTLPAGLTLSSSGTISGTPTTAVASSFSVTVKDSESTPQTATGSLALTIIKGSGGVTPPPSGSSTLAAAYTAYIAAHYGSAQGYNSANTYYISTTGSDNAAGTSSAPWATIAHADSAAPAGSLIYLLPGTWSPGSRVAHTTSSGLSTRHTAYVSTTYGGAVLISNAISDNGDGTLWSSGDYVDWVGLDISAVGCFGIFIDGNYGNYVYNRVHDITPSAGSGWCGNGMGGGGIDFAVGDGVNAHVLNNIIWNVGYSGNVYQHGIYTTGAGTVVQNNIVYGGSGGGIQAYHQPVNEIITNNVLVGNHWGYIVGASSSSLPASGMVFNNNVLMNNSTNDIQECGADYCGVAMGSGNTYSNNDTNSSSGNHLEGGVLENNITANPDFVSATSPASGGNFDVTSGSPLITAGTSNNAPATDILGAARNTADPSIGAYEQ